MEEEEGVDEIEHEACYGLFAINSKEPRPTVIQMKLNDIDFVVEIDTGATSSIISQEAYNSMFSGDFND